MAYHPAYAIGLLVLALLMVIASWGWLQFVKYPTNSNRDNAARFTAWLFGFGAFGVAFVLFDLLTV
ncbi:MAG: hypothetical protein ACLGHC_01800 [Alphaproteobacteria bacterium]